MNTDVEVITINSDSEDEAVPPPSLPAPVVPEESSSSDGSICGEPSTSRFAFNLRPYKSPATTEDIQRRCNSRIAPPQASLALFPAILKINTEFRAVFGMNYSQSKVMKIVQNYIRCLKDLQEQIYKFPNKCRVLSRNVCRTLLLLREMNKHCLDEPYYLQKVCELLAIYTHLELRFASGFSDSKIKIAERIISNIFLHFNPTETSYILRIFAYIPYMGKETEIVSKIFRRLFPEPILVLKHEFSDRLYIQHLIAFYHWKDAESLYDDQQKVIAFANKYMKPMHSLKSSYLYAPHLPSYVKRDDATTYFLSNMVFFNDLRNASLLDMPETVPDTIDLSEDMDTVELDFAKLELYPLSAHARLGENEVATVDLTKIDDDPPWLTNLVRRAIDREVELPRILPELNISDDENLVSAIEKSTANNSVEKIHNQMDTAIDLPDKSSSGMQAAHAAEEQVTNATETVVAIDEEVPENSANTISDVLDSRVLFSTCFNDDISEKRAANQSSSKEIIASPRNQTLAVADVIASKENVFIKGEVSKHKANNCAKKTGNSEIATTLNVVFNGTLNAASKPSEETLNSNVTGCENEETLRIVNRIPLKTYSRKALKKTETAAPETLTEENSDSEAIAVVNKPAEAIAAERTQTELTVTKNTAVEAPVAATTVTDTSTVETSTVETTAAVVAAIEEERLFEDCNVFDDIDSASNSASYDEVSNKPANVVFSNKMISLREDENAYGNTTPSGDKTPEFTEVSEGSNVIFSLKGRRFSSLPPLEETSSKPPTAPVFDEQLLSKAEERVQQRPIIKTAIKSNLIKESEKPAAKRRNVRFSDKNECREYEIPTSPPQSPVNPTSAIKKCLFNNQHTSTTSHSTTSHSTSTASSTPLAASVQPDIVKRLAPHITPPSAGTAVLKSAQEQELVHKLFPDLVFKPLPKNITSSSTAKPIKKRRNTTNSDNSNTASANSKANRNAIQGDNRRKSVTPVPRKQHRSDFDKYLYHKYNLVVRSPDTVQTDAVKKPKHRVSQRTVTKSLIDITNDEKLTTLRAIVLVERLCEAVFRAKMEQQFVSSACAFKLSPSETVSAPTLSVRRKTKSLSDILTDTVEQEQVAPQSPPAKKAFFEPEETHSTSAILKRSAKKQLEESSSLGMNSPSSGIVNDKSIEEKPAAVIDNDAKTHSQLLPLKSEVSSIKLEEQDTELSINKSTKSSKSTSRIGNKRQRRVRKAQVLPPTPLTSQEEGSSVGSPAERLSSSQLPASTEFSNRPPPTTTTQISDLFLITASYAAENAVLDAPPSTIDESTLLLKSPSKAAHSQEELQSDTSKDMCSPNRQVKVRLKRLDIHDVDEYTIVSNSALELDREMQVHIPNTGQSNEHTICDVLENQNNVLSTERKRRLKRSAAKKGRALKKIFERVVDEKLDPVAAKNVTIETANGPRDLVNGDIANQGPFSATNGHIIPPSPPLTPPMPSLSPPPQTEDKSAAFNISLQSNSPADCQLHTGEPNNNCSSESSTPLQTADQALEGYLSSSSDVIQEFRQYAIIPREVEIGAGFLARFYAYIVERKDIQAREEIKKIMPLLRSKVFMENNSQSCLPRRRFESCCLSSLERRRSRKLSSSDFCEENSSISTGMWDSKRRKTICSESNYLRHSPDFIFDEEICASPKAADSPTLEVMRLHTRKRKVHLNASNGIQTSIGHTGNSENDTKIQAEVDEKELVPMETVNQSTTSSSLMTTTSSPSSPSVHLKVENECTSHRTDCDCESPIDSSRNMAVSRTYSKSNMVQHVFVPPEIEKCIEEQASKDPKDSDNMPSTSKGCAAKGNNGGRYSQAKTAKVHSRSQARKLEQSSANSVTNSVDGVNQDNDADCKEKEKTVKKTAAKRKRPRKNRTTSSRKT